MSAALITIATLSACCAALAYACIIHGKATDDTGDERTDRSNPIPAAPSVGSAVATRTAGDGAPIPCDCRLHLDTCDSRSCPSLGRHLSADDFDLLHDSENGL